MKRFTSFFLTAMCCAMALLPTVDANAQVIVDGIYYKKNAVVKDGGNYYNHLQGDVAIADYVAEAGGTISKISDQAFQKMQPQVRFSLPNTIEEIGDYAFKEATGLQSIQLNEGLMKLGYEVFMNCSNLTTINIPSTLTEISMGTFEGCSSLSSIVLPSNITTIGGHAFAGCTSLQTVKGSTADDIQVKKIYANAFADCTNLQHIEFSDLESIEEGAFRNCSKLEHITLPESLIRIGDFVFANTGLKTVTANRSFPPGIKANAFDGVDLSQCTLYVPYVSKDKYMEAEVWKKFGKIVGTDNGGVFVARCKIGDFYYDFYDNFTAKLVWDKSYASLSGFVAVPVSLTREGYTYTVTAIQGGVFENCKELTKVILPNTITELPDETFKGCSALTSVTLPTSLKRIGKSAFEESGITSINIPSTVTSLGISAFKNCKSLTSISLSDGITDIPNYCFEKSGLNNVKIPSAAKAIGIRAFGDCFDLSSIIISVNVTSIGDAAFLGCSELMSIKCNNPKPVDLSSAPSVFFGVNHKKCYVYVPSGSGIPYRNAREWSSFHNICDEGVNKIIKIGDLYYQLNVDRTAMVTSETSGTDNYSSLSGEITVEDKVDYRNLEYKVIGVEPQAFQNCTGITKVNLPKVMDIIYGSAFKNCTNLADINIPATLTHLDHYAFNGTKLFNDNKDEDGAVYYDHCLIYYPLNSKEGNYEVKPGTRLLASYVFSGDVKLKGLILPEGLQCICKYALDGMQRLETLSLPSSVYFVADGFCNNAKKLSTIYNYMKTPLDVSEVKNCFENVSQNLCTLYVPAGKRTTYQKAEKWKDFSIMEMTAVYTVTFEDYDGRKISVQQVPKDADAIKPNDPNREGYDFTGWDEDFTNVQTDLTVTAQYERQTYTVLFVDGYTDGVLDTQYIEYGESAIEPEVLTHDGYAFIGWDKEFDVITENIIVTAQYIIPGDVNGDGQVNIADAVAIANYLLGKTVKGFNEAAADINFDGVINIADIVAVANILLSGK
ncbi:MAG: leucine-rich repeat protein [Prevotella sp.]|nr:leucine-rich repeat protein [Prevotella sp.]